MTTTLDSLPVEITPEDRAYKGSRYANIVSAIFANPYQRVWGAAGEPALPVHKVTFRSVAGGILAASERTIDSGADLRWGANRLGFRRLVHPNGVCLTGTWRILERSDYTGYFAQGEPSTELPAWIDQPEGVFTKIERDVLGNPTAVTRSGPGGG